MARILEFTIRGLAGRKGPLHMILNRDVNIFWGLNGTGKTSLLKILHSAMLNDASSIVQAPFDSATVIIETESGIYKQEIKKLKRTQERVHIETLLAEGEPISERQLLLLEDELQWRTSPPLPDGVRRFQHSYLPISRIAEVRHYQRPVRRLERELADEAGYDQFFAEQIMNRWRNYNTDTLVRVRSLQDRGIADILLSVLGASKAIQTTDAPEPQAAYQVVKNVFGTHRGPLRLTFPQFAKTYANDELAKRVVSQIQDLSFEIEEAQMPQFRLEWIIRELFRGKKEISFGAREITVRIGDDDVPLSALSSGEKQMLRILVECLAAGGSTVLIDEPELSLHVDWQRRLVECMQVVNHDCQLILATHSPEVMAEIGDGQIFEL